jgi:restriction system protein
MMAKKNSFVNLLNAAAKDAERRTAQAQRERVREEKELARELTRLEREEARTQRALDAETKRSLKEQRLAVRHSQVAVMNEELTTDAAQIDTLLDTALARDAYLDLSALSVTEVEHPPFDPGPVPAHPGDLTYPPQPVYSEPPPATGWFGKKQHEKTVHDTHAHYSAVLDQWKSHCSDLYRSHMAALAAWEKGQADVVTAQNDYDQAQAARDRDAQDRNAATEELINGLAFDVPEAIEEYVAVVIASSPYPDNFAVTVQCAFDIATRELALAVGIPEPSDMPTVKGYKYVASKDDIVATNLTAKAQRERYVTAVSAVALRTLHEVFQADRENKVWAISLTVGVDRVSPATGNQETVPLVALACTRDTFTAINLSNVEPAATLDHLGAAVSKKPWDLVPIAASRGVRTPKAG